MVIKPRPIAPIVMPKIFQTDLELALFKELWNKYPDKPKLIKTRKLQLDPSLLRIYLPSLN